MVIDFRTSSFLCRLTDLLIIRGRNDDKTCHEKRQIPMARLRTLFCSWGAGLPEWIWARAMATIRTGESPLERRRIDRIVTRPRARRLAGKIEFGARAKMDGALVKTVVTSHWRFSLAKVKRRRRGLNSASACSEATRVVA